MVPVDGWRPRACSAEPAAIFPLESADSELLLQTRGRRGVLEHQPLVRIDVAVRLLRHQSALMEAGEDQLQLAWISVDVTDGEHAGNVCFERRGVDGNE